MEHNNLYNFKNPVKHFLNIDQLQLPNNISNYQINKLSWVEPIVFRIKKQEDAYRTLKMPNILNFFCAYEHFKDMSNFNNIKAIDPVHKRLTANIKTGDFISGEYDIQLEEDFERLCIYDNLIRLDIKDFYGRIYTHDIDFEEHTENYLSNMNLGATNGILLGNYISLYFAERELKKISLDIYNQISQLGLLCEFSYFSDDFYFFCNERDQESIITIFNNVLESHGYERNESKKEIWTYEMYNNYNLVARYWKKITYNCLIKFNYDKTDNSLHFINQIIYRMSLLADDKLKRILINCFFKTKYFNELILDNYEFRTYDYHQLGFILKFCPEAILYIIPKFVQTEKFKKNKLKKYLKVRYFESLKKKYHEEQLYIFFAIKVLNFNDIIIEAKDLAYRTDNQILISYYLKDNLFSPDQIHNLKLKKDEKYWFQNYHLILYSDLYSSLDESIKEYLIPHNATKQRQKNSYLNFYKENLSSHISLIMEISDVIESINEYLELRVKEYEENYENRISRN